MATAATPVPLPSRPRWTALGLLLLAAALLCHLLAAHAIGGSYRAYRDHTAGFVILTAVPGLVLWLLGRRFWPGRPHVTLLVLGVLDLAMGIWVYINRYAVHG